MYKRQGNVSDFVIVTRSLELSVTDAGDRLHQLPRGGYCSTTMKINVATGLLTFHHPDFVFQSVTGNIYEYENVSQVSETIDFGGLISGTVAFLAHHPQDESPEKFTNDFIAVEEQTSLPTVPILEAESNVEGISYPGIASIIIGAIIVGIIVTVRRRRKKS